MNTQSRNDEKVSHVVVVEDIGRSRPFGQGTQKQNPKSPNDLQLNEDLFVQDIVGFVAHRCARYPGFPNWLLIRAKL